MFRVGGEQWTHPWGQRWSSALPMRLFLNWYTKRQAESYNTAIKQFQEMRLASCPHIMPEVNIKAGRVANNPERQRSIIVRLWCCCCAQVWILVSSSVSCEHWPHLFPPCLSFLICKMGGLELQYPSHQVVVRIKMTLQSVWNYSIVHCQYFLDLVSPLSRCHRAADFFDAQKENSSIFYFLKD